MHIDIGIGIGVDIGRDEPTPPAPPALPTPTPAPTSIVIPGYLADSGADSRLTACITCTGLLIALLCKKDIMSSEEVDSMFDNAVAIAKGAQEEAGEAAVDRLIGSLEQGRNLFKYLIQPGVLP
jgi:hypothetical protein